MMGSLLGLLNSRDLSVEDSPISARNLAELLKLLDQGTISGKIAKTVFEEMARSGGPASEIVESKGLVQISDTDAIEKIVDRVVDSCPDEALAYQNGKTKLMGFFVGQVMRETKGKANPQVVNELLKKRLDA